MLTMLYDFVGQVVVLSWYKNPRFAECQANVLLFLGAETRAGAVSVDSCEIQKRGGFDAAQATSSGLHPPPAVQRKNVRAAAK
jgi:hypothetical protein